MWRYFTRGADLDFAMCNQCMKLVPYKQGNTSYLNNHLAKHLLEFEDVNIESSLDALPSTSADSAGTPDSGECEIFEDVNNLSSATTTSSQELKNLLRSRQDTSLGLLTQRFAEMLRCSADGVLDLNLVCQELKAPKRRVYDITNVLEGIRLIKKKSKNFIQWLVDPSKVDLQSEIKSLTEEEARLDVLIRSCRQQLRQLCEDKTNQSYPLVVVPLTVTRRSVVLTTESSTFLDYFMGYCFIYFEHVNFEHKRLI